MAKKEYRIRGQGVSHPPMAKNEYNIHLCPRSIASIHGQEGVSHPAMAKKEYHIHPWSNVSRAYNIQYDGSTTKFTVSSSAVHCLPVGNVLRMSNCVIINIYVARRKQYHRLLLSHMAKKEYHIQPWPRRSITSIRGRKGVSHPSMAKKEYHIHPWPRRSITSIHGRKGVSHPSMAKKEYRIQGQAVMRPPQARVVGGSLPANPGRILLVFEQLVL